MEILNREIISTAEQLPQLTVANLAFKYGLLEREYMTIADKWIDASTDYLLIEALFHLAMLARRERVHPVYANMLINDWVKAPSHTQTLCWFHQSRNAVRRYYE